MDKRTVILTLQLSLIALPVKEGYSASTTQGGINTGAVAKAMSATAANGAASEAVPAAKPATPKPAYQQYSYYGDRYRDPFIPLTGEFHKDQLVDRPPQISTLLLKGILQDQKGRMALLTAGSNSYILRGGRLYDGRNHLMKGISGVIKSASVVLMGSDRTVRELRVTPTL